MDIIKRNKILIWVTVFLLVGNVGLVASILIKNRTQAPKKIIQKKYNSEKGSRFGDFLAEELQLNNSQYETYIISRKAHFESQNMLRNAIHIQKQSIHDELFKSNPDTLYIMELADSIGKLNAAFEKSNYYYFLSLKDFLNKDQTDRLQEIMNHQSFTGKRHKHRHGKGRR